MYDNLFNELEPTMLIVCLESIERHVGEHFYSVALYTSGEYGYLVDSLATLEGLQLAATKYLADENYFKQWGTMIVATRELKWSPCDSPYHCEFASNFSRVKEILNSIWQGVDDNSDEEYQYACQEIHETCIAVLSSVRKSGIFDNEQVVFNLLKGDQSDEERLVIAETLNSTNVIDRFRLELDIDEDVLREFRLDS